MLDRRDTDASPFDVDGLQEFLGFDDEELGLSFTVHGDVRLDAGVPTRVDATPGRLLEPSLRSTSCRNFIDVFNEFELKRK